MTYIEIATFLQTKIIYLFAYFPVITLIGFLQAWINTKAGDDTAKNWGFLTLDPMVHFELFGFMILMFPWQLFGSDINIGFGKFIPSSVEGLVGKWQRLRKVVILFSAAMATFTVWMFFNVLAVLFYTIFLSLQQASLSGSVIAMATALLQLSGGLVRLSSELFFVFFIINIVDALLYKFDKNGTIRNNVFLRFGLILIAAMLFAPIMRMIFILIIKILLLKA